MPNIKDFTEKKGKQGDSKQIKCKLCTRFTDVVDEVEDWGVVYR